MFRHTEEAEVIDQEGDTIALFHDLQDAKASAGIANRLLREGNDPEEVELRIRTWAEGDCYV